MVGTSSERWYETTQRSDWPVAATEACFADFSVHIIKLAETPLFA